MTATLIQKRQCILTLKTHLCISYGVVLLYLLPVWYPSKMKGSIVICVYDKTVDLNSVIQDLKCYSYFLLSTPVFVFFSLCILFTLKNFSSLLFSYHFLLGGGTFSFLFSILVVYYLILARLYIFIFFLLLCTFF